MSTRYPGTQFIVKDNSQTSAIVPVSNTNASTPTYMSCFRSVKGPEKIMTSKGQNFYDKYGTQDYVKFEKYGQPLFQASMNINNGASILGKRAVLDDATLANATVAITLTKTKDTNGNIKYSLSPVVFSINNNQVISNIDTRSMYETKDIIDLYKKYIIEAIENNSTDPVFLNELGVKLPSPITESIMNSDNTIIGYSNLPRYTPVNTVYSNFTVDEDIINNNRLSPVSTEVYFFVKTKNSTSGTCSKLNTDTFNGVEYLIKTLKGNEDIEEVYIYFGLERNKNTGVLDTEGSGNYPKALVYKKKNNSKCEITTKMISNALSRLSEMYNLIGESTDPIPYNNKLYVLNPDYDEENCADKENIATIVQKNHAIEVKEYFSDDYSTYIFPLFTVFDNGRGESIKNISISFDANSSKTLNKAIYKLTVHNYKTDKQLESFAFSLNPYEINNSTGYAFDIESAVNNVSNQIEVKTYYNSYEALSTTLQRLLNSTSETIVSDHDILFGHLLTGNYPSYSSINLNTLLKRTTNLYDYAHLNIFDSDTVTVNVSYDLENTTNKNYTGNIKYYFYDYNRSKSNWSERLEYGTDGYYINRDEEKQSEVELYTLDKDIDYDIIKVTGHKAGKSFNNPDLTPIYNNNFISISRDVCEVTKHIYDKTNNKWVEDATTTFVNEKCDKLIDSSMLTKYRSFNGDIRYTRKSNSSTKSVIIYIPYTEEYLYQEQYRRFFSGEFDRNIFNLDIYFPNVIFDANYNDIVKLAIQRLVAYRGDLMCYMDMGINRVNSLQDCCNIIPTEDEGTLLVEDTTTINPKYYIRDMHVGVTCLYYSIRNPYNNKIITVTGTYGLSNIYINHFTVNPSAVFAGISNNIIIDGIIEGTVNYIPKIYPTSNMTSMVNIGGVYPSDDETIQNEKQKLCDLRVNYGCYYDSRFSIETEYTMHPVESEFSYWNNVALVCLMMQAIRKACPAARYQFVTREDLEKYQSAVSNAMTPWRNKFASLNFKYVQDTNALQNKIFYAAIEVTFKPFAQTEVFTLTALNYSTMNSNITNI